MERTKYYFGLTRMWWVPLITGLIFIGFGAWCLCDPAPSLEILAYIFAGAVGLIGIGNLIYGINSYNSNHGWGWSLASGCVELIFSIFMFFVPSVVLTYFFVYGVGLYIIFSSIYSFFGSVMIVKNSPAWVTFIVIFLLAAVISGIIVVLGPVGTGTIGWLFIGISFCCYGVFRILLSAKIKELNNSLKNGNE